MLDYRLLEAFAAVVEEGGFERAAARLFVTQSAVSQRVKQLEDEVGRILVVRETPPRATEAGERLLRHFRQVAGLEEDALGDLGLREASEFRHLPIAVNADTLSVWLLEAVTPFLRDRAVTLEILVNDQEHTLKFLKSGVVAGCISSERATIQGFTTTRIGAMRYFLVASPRFARKWFPKGIDRESAASAPVVHFSRDDRLQYLSLGKLYGKPQVVPPAYYVPSTDAFIDAIVTGLVYGVIPEVQAAPLLAAKKLVELDPGGRIDSPLYWYRWSRPSTLLEELTSCILTEGSRILAGSP